MGRSTSSPGLCTGSPRRPRRVRPRRGLTPHRPRHELVVMVIGSQVRPPSVVHHSGPPLSRGPAQPSVGDRKSSASGLPSASLIATAGFHVFQLVPPSSVATSTVPSVPIQCV
jgi:hypothetical protein